MLATFHRPENVDDVDRSVRCSSISQRLDLPVLFPVHPRTRKRIRGFRARRERDRIEMVPPLGYKTFLGLAAECAFLVSDSGGVQEEASVVKRPAIIVRRSTDRRRSSAPLRPWCHPWPTFLSWRAISSPPR